MYANASLRFIGSVFTDIFLPPFVCVLSFWYYIFRFFRSVNRFFIKNAPDFSSEAYSGICHAHIIVRSCLRVLLTIFRTPSLEAPSSSPIFP